MTALTQQQHNTFTILQPVGNLDFFSASAFQNELLSALQNGVAHLIIDMSKVSSVDSSGLGALVRGTKTALNMHVDLRLVSASQQVRHVLKMTGLDYLLRL